MHNRYYTGAGTVLATLLTTTAAFAEVTPQEVWDSWRGYLESFGYDVVASTEITGSAINVSDITMLFALPDDQGNVEMTMPGMQFVDNGDGTVAIVLPDRMPINVQVTPTDEGDDVSLTILYDAPGMEMTASGSVDDLAIRFAGPQMLVELSSLSVNGETLDNAKVKIGLDDVTGNYGIKSGDLRVINETVTAGGLNYAVAVTDPEGSGFFTLSGQSEALTLVATMALPLDYDPTNPNGALKDGLAFDTSYTTGAGNLEFAFKDGEQLANGTSATAGSSFGFALDKNELGYKFAANGWDIALAGSDIPFPINFSTARTAMELKMPVAKTDIPKDFAMRFELIEFAPDDMIWSMMDPMGGMPHDPATFVISLVGKGNWLFDILDPEQAMEAAGADIPFELQALTLEDLRVSAVGAELTGLGSFVFNNNDLTTFDGLPAPDGSVDLRLVGANGLIDRLIGMGLMSDDDAMGMRMMLGLFGRPGEGEDEVLSTIEVRSNGQITANGQRLQ